MSSNDKSVKEEAKTEDAPEIERNIEETRAKMSATIDELHGKLNPAVLKDQALEQFQQAKAQLKADLATELSEVKEALRSELRDAKDGLREATIGKVEHMVDDAQDTVKRTGTSILDTMRDNPVPTALIGLGLGWLFVNARSRSSARLDARAYGAYGRNGQAGRRQPTVETTARQLGTRATRFAHEVGDHAAHLASDVAGTVQSTASGAASAVAGEAKDIARRAGELGGRVQQAAAARLHDAEDFVTSNASSAGSAAMTVARDARDQAVEWEGALERTLRENPLVVGAVAVALGMAVGLSIPSTTAEDQLLGKVRDDALDRAAKLADEAVGGADGAVGHLLEGATGADNGRPQHANS